MGSKTWGDGVRHKYILQKIKPQGWVAACNAKTDDYRLIYLVTLHVTWYDIYNLAMWHKIKNCCIGTTVYYWIREFEAK